MTRLNKQIPLRPQNRGLDRVAGGAFTKLRPAMVEHGVQAAILLRAGKKPPPPTDRIIELLTREFERTEYVGEEGIATATAHGTNDGKRRPLTKRMQQILQCYADGKTAKEIAVETGTSVANVHNRGEAARFSLDAVTITQAVAIAVQAELVTAKRLPIYETQGRKPAHNATKKTTSRVREKGELIDRELHVLRLVVDGFPNVEVGARLGLSEEQVKHSLKNLQRYLGVQGRIQVAVEAVRRGLT